MMSYAKSLLDGTHTGAHMSPSQADCEMSAGRLRPMGVGRVCPVVWDGWLCWPPTLGGATIKQPCPDIHNFNTQQFAYRNCLTNGTWYGRHGSSGWSNYSLCVLSSPTAGAILPLAHDVTSAGYDAVRTGQQLFPGPSEHTTQTSTVTQMVREASGDAAFPLDDVIGSGVHAVSAVCLLLALVTWATLKLTDRLVTRRYLVVVATIVSAFLFHTIVLTSRMRAVALGVGRHPHPPHHAPLPLSLPPPSPLRARRPPAPSLDHHPPPPSPLPTSPSLPLPTSSRRSDSPPPPSQPGRKQPFTLPLPQRAARHVNPTRSATTTTTTTTASVYGKTLAPKRQLSSAVFGGGGKKEKEMGVASLGSSSPSHDTDGFEPSSHEFGRARRGFSSVDPNIRPDRRQQQTAKSPPFLLLPGVSSADGGHADDLFVSSPRGRRRGVVEKRRGVEEKRRGVVEEKRRGVEEKRRGVEETREKRRGVEEKRRGVVEETRRGGVEEKREKRRGKEEKRRRGGLENTPGEEKKKGKHNKRGRGKKKKKATREPEHESSSPRAEKSDGREEEDSWVSLCQVGRVFYLLTDLCVYALLFSVCLYYTLVVLGKDLTFNRLVTMFLFGLGVPVVFVVFTILLYTFLPTYAPFGSSCTVDALGDEFHWATTAPKLICIVLALCLMTVSTYGFWRLHVPALHASSETFYARQGVLKSLALLLACSLAELFFLVTEYQKMYGQVTSPYIVQASTSVLGAKGCVLAFLLCFLDSEVLHGTCCAPPSGDGEPWLRTAPTPGIEGTAGGSSGSTPEEVCEDKGRKGVRGSFSCAYGGGDAAGRQHIVGSLGLGEKV